MSAVDRAWALEQVAGLPRPWAARLLRDHEQRAATFNPARVTAEGTARRKANEALRAAVAQLAPVNPEVPLDASDHDLCAQAFAGAEQCRARWLAMQGGACSDADQRELLGQMCLARGIAAPGAQYEDRGAVRRMIDERWWRGQLRKVHARAVEAAAQRLALVAKDRECYVSSVSLEARTAQNARNAATLENTLCRNLDTDQEFTLAELAARGVANKAIRRAELMTRINGFERVAIASAHLGLFATITCPSKMHRMRTVGGGRAVENSKWDGTTPREAQQYLGRVWARVRAALARRGVSLYGFRIAEPQHDGTPHWHCLFFYRPEHDAVVRSTLRQYALAMDGDEKGAQANRVDLKRMDPAKGTAAGYIAKYVSKNIDGYRLEKDLYGNDSLETSARVEAWASRWRIRQFQQIGGPPVTVWRELRRVEGVPSDAPAFVRQAHDAVNRIAVIEGRENASVAWDRYVDAQGGVSCGRAYRVRIAKAENDKPNRYGEQGTARIVGIEYHEIAKVRDAIGNWIDVMPRNVTVESRRYEWEIVRRRVAARGFGFERAQRAPRTCVNNCTEGSIERSEYGGYGGEIDPHATSGHHGNADDPGSRGGGTYPEGRQDGP